MVVPLRKVAPKSLPDRSWMVRMAKSILSARCDPSGLPKPETRSWRVLNIKFLNWWLSSTKRWSMPIILKSTASSLRSAILSWMPCSLASRVCFRFSKPLSIAREMSAPCWRRTSRFSSIESFSFCKIASCISRAWGIIPNCSWVNMMQSQSLFLMSLKMRWRFCLLKSFLPG